MNTPEVPPNKAADSIEDDDEVKFCDNTHCDAEAIETVDVSVKQAGDEERNYCGACLEAYYVGVQHGRKIAKAGLPDEQGSQSCWYDNTQ